jgi:transcriptional regulator GlxA family with amidase domain
MRNMNMRAVLGWSTALVAAAMLVLVISENPAAAAEGERRPQNMTVGIVVYQGMEILDFAGPAEVFAARGLNVYTVSDTKDPIISQGFVRITPEYTVENAPRPDILVIPGGSSSRVTDSKPMMSWIRKSSEGAEIVLTVCTGAFVLAEMKVLDGMEATTWHGQIANFRRAVPKTVVHENVRFVDNGKYVTTAGVSAGIDGSLHVVAKLFGEDAAHGTARYMEYDKWRPRDGRIVPNAINARYEQNLKERAAVPAANAAPARIENGVQVVEITVTDDGYQPQSVELKKGVPAKLVFDRRTSSGCFDEVISSGLGVPRTRLAATGKTTIDVTPKEEGSFTIACGMEMFRTTAVVR